MRASRHSLRYWSMIAVIAPWSILACLLSLYWFAGVVPKIGLSIPAASISGFTVCALFGLFCLWWAYFSLDASGQEPSRKSLVLLGLAVGVVASVALSVLVWRQRDPTLSFLTVVPIPFAISYARTMLFGSGGNAV
jgi:hypothetical protein